ncbi:MAG: hypothetical protein MJ233_05260 [Mycoplasmoidaceae bacterium]|nr:hypothetical protein [Mycoplasmoidaceae bacterium]
MTDIDFDVIFYSIDDTVFSHVLESELDEGLYYCKDNMICAQTESDISTSTQMKIVVKFNNHNGEDINVKWSNQPLQ